MKQLYEWVSTQRKNHRKKVLKRVRTLSTALHCLPPNKYRRNVKNLA
jgi:hypothetical protein